MYQPQKKNNYFVYLLFVLLVVVLVQTTQYRVLLMINQSRHKLLDKLLDYLG